MQIGAVLPLCAVMCFISTGLGGRGLQKRPSSDQFRPTFYRSISVKLKPQNEHQLATANIFLIHQKTSDHLQNTSKFHFKTPPRQFTSCTTVISSNFAQHDWKVAQMSVSTDLFCSGKKLIQHTEGTHRSVICGGGGGQLPPPRN